MPDLEKRSREARSHARPSTRSRWALVGIAMLAACARTRPAPDAMQDAHFDLEGPIVVSMIPAPRPVVSVALNGRPLCPFLVDCGSDTTLIDARRASDLGLEIRPYAGTAKAQGSSGNIIPIESFVPLERMEIGGLVVHDARVVVVDDPALDNAEVFGILGQDLLARLTLIVDMQRGELHILPQGGSDAVREYLSSAELGAGAWVQVETEFRPCPFLPMSVAGLKEPLEILIDTGAERTDFPRAAIGPLGLHAAGTKERGGIGGEYMSEVYQLENLSLFGLNISAEVGVVPLEHGMLGMDILGKLAFVLDGPSRTVWLHHRE